MTANQIAYWSLAESKDYHSRVTAENTRHNKASERLQGEINAETKRHNLEAERLSWANYGEVYRHNTRTERAQDYYNRNLAWFQKQQAEETNRHNLAIEDIQRASEARQKEYSDWSMRHQDLQLIETTAKDILTIGNSWYNSYLTSKRDAQTARRDSQNFWSHIIGSAANAASSIFGSAARAGLLS